jgi:hypothetical protein
MYVYAEQKQELFTDEGQRLFLALRDHAQKLLKMAGAVRAQEIMNAPRSGCCDSWQLLACVDRMVEIGDLIEVTAQDKWASQHRVFVSAREQ